MLLYRGGNKNGHWWTPHKDIAQYFSPIIWCAEVDIKSIPAADIGYLLWDENGQLDSNTAQTIKRLGYNAISKPIHIAGKQSTIGFYLLEIPI